MSRWWLVPSLLLWVVLSACGASGSMAAMSDTAAEPGYAAGYGPEMAPPAPPMDPVAQLGGGEMRAEPPGQPPAPSPAPQTRPDATGNTGTGVQTRAQPLLIYTAQYNLAVYEAASVLDSVQKLAEEKQGYLVRRGDRDITIRVPSGVFRDTLGAITKLGDVLHREETVEDVTERFMDLQIRLKNARAVRDRLEALLVEAKDVKDAILVEQELARVTADIESMEGKLKLLSELIAFSTITVTLEPRPTDKVGSGVRLPFPWLENLGLTNLMNL